MGIRLADQFILTKEREMMSKNKIMTLTILGVFVLAGIMLAPMVKAEGQPRLTDETVKLFAERWNKICPKIDGNITMESARAEGLTLIHKFILNVDPKHVHNFIIGMKDGAEITYCPRPTVRRFFEQGFRIKHEVFNPQGKLLKAFTVDLSACYERETRRPEPSSKLFGNIK